jgi:hypothetical protein
MLRSRKRRRVAIPVIGTAKATTKDFEYVKGWNSNLSNDDVPVDQWRLVTDAREIEIGKWQTRLGNDLLSIPVGEAVNVQQTSVTGASDFSFTAATRFAKKTVATATGPLTAVELNLKNTATATGTIVVAVYDDNAGEPGTELMRSTIASSVVTSTYAYCKARSITCPTITNTSTYWVVGYVQDGGSNSYQISTTTNASTGLTSTNSGTTWSAASLDFNVKLSTATAGGVKGTIRVLRPSGSAYTFLAHDSTLYSVNEGTGVTTAVDTGLDASATYCRFEFVNDVLYYVTGLQKPRKYDFATASEITTAPENAAAIIEHKGVVFYLSAADVTKMYYTNFAAYSTFTSTDFIYVPAPKTADPAVGYFRLNGLLYISTLHNKYVLYGAENATFRLDNAVGQKGTYSQESIAYDENNAYFANDDGIWQFNGAQERNIAKDILTTWTSLLSKSGCVLELHDNRLYVFYTPNGGGENSRCLVYNILYDIWESNDTRAYVGQAFSRYAGNNYFLQGSNRCGMVMLAEQSTNDHNTMGEPLSYELDTAYVHYDTPAQLKGATFRPHFDTITGSYSIQVGYATDYSDSPVYVDVSLSGTGSRFDTGVLYDSGATYSGAQQVNPMDNAPAIPGRWRRLQLRYKHEAAREPVTFDGHVLQIETQRVA